MKELDGGTISPAQIDATVTRLMTAGEVTGAGIAIFNGGKVAYQKERSCAARIAVSRRGEYFLQFKTKVDELARFAYGDFVNGNY